MSKTFIELMATEYGISEEIVALYEKATEFTNKNLSYLSEIVEYNQLKVLKAFRDHKVSNIHFASTSGYGYDDMGRDALDKVYAQIFGAEDAMVRHNIISGTHALSLCLFGVLRPGDTLVAAIGKPYDTLEEVIGIRNGDNMGSLADFGVSYKQVDLNNGAVDYQGILEAVDENTKAVLIQKSKGYDWRPSLTNEEIGKVIQTVKSKNSEAICIVDNCYGEFVEKTEPCEFGADLVAGSLIKNPGGGIAQTGGYIAGRAKYVELVSYKLNSVGLGKECGATLGFNRSMFMGIFMAPHIVGQAIKTAVFCSKLFQCAGFEVNPKPEDRRTDIIQAVKLGNRNNLIRFCQGIQAGSPIDSYVQPVPWAMPGYADEVIMAAGTFTQGASIEISADGPLKEPYIAYLQGGLTFDSAKVAILNALHNIL